MSPDSDGARGRPVASVARALALLDELGAAPDGLGVNELARRIGVNASTASRLLATLEDPVTAPLWALLDDPGFRDAVEALGGYATGEMGRRIR